LITEITSLEDPEEIRELIKKRIWAHEKRLKRAYDGKIP
jgi:hypothetical protein